jgi:hypothetical protein
MRGERERGVREFTYSVYFISYKVLSYESKSQSSYFSLIIVYIQGSKKF